MFFEKDTIPFNILDVLYINENSATTYTSGRNFDAISFRYHADTIIKTDKNKYHLKDNYVTHFSARSNYKRIAKNEEMIVIHFETMNNNVKNIEFFESKAPEKLSKLFREIFDCWIEKKVGYKFKCSAIFYEILAECYMQNYHKKDDTSKISASIDYINHNYKNSNLTVKQAANRSFISDVYFRKLFKKQFGITPQKYIINLRIQNAIMLISTGYYSLKEVSYMSGYTDYKYFSLEFKKRIGVSPSKYVYNYEPSNNNFTLNQNTPL